MAANTHEINLRDALANLRWSAEGDMWSARVTPAQSRALLAEMDILRERADNPPYVVARPPSDAPEPEYKYGRRSR